MIGGGGQNWATIQAGEEAHFVRPPNTDDTYLNHSRTLYVGGHGQRATLCIASQSRSYFSQRPTGRS